MRRSIKVQGVTHIKIAGSTGVQSAALSNPKGRWEEFIPDSTIRKVDAISYIDQNDRDVSLSSFGFSNDYDNLFGESKIIVELANDLDGYPQVPLCDICQLRVDVHRPYDNQELVSTGLLTLFPASSFHVIGVVPS